MTEAVKQWITDQSREIGTVRGFLGHKRIDEKRQLGAMTALIKGIEIAEGFAEWIALYNIKRSTIPNCYVYRGYILPTSQLLQMYLEHLSSINKEK